MLRAISFLFALLLALPAQAQNTLFPANPGDMIVKGGASAWVAVPGGTAGCVLTSNGPAAAPTWQCALALNFHLPPTPPNTVWGNKTGVQSVPTAITASDVLNTLDYDIQRPPLPGATVYKGTDNKWHTAPPAPAGWVWTSMGAGQIPQWAGIGTVPQLGNIGFYVDHTNGVDGNFFCTSPAAPCKTIHYAYQQTQSVPKILSNGALTINSDCNFTETPTQNFIGPAANSTSVVFIVGNQARPDLCTWTSDGWGVDNGATISLRGFRTATITPGATWLSVAKLGIVVFANMIFGPNVGGAHVVIGGGGQFVAEDATSIYQVGDAVGGCAPTCFNYHIINNGGTFEFAGHTGNGGTTTVVVPQALRFNAWYAGSGSGSQTNFGTNAFSGLGAGTLSTGKPYEMQRLASIDTANTQFPGNANPTMITNACSHVGCSGVTELFGNTPSLAQNTTNWCGVAYCTLSPSTGVFRLPDNGLLRNLQVQASVAPAGGQTFVVTIYASGDTLLTCTISNPSTSCNDLTHNTGLLAASQSVYVKVDMSATSGAATFAYGIRMESSP